MNNENKQYMGLIERYKSKSVTCGLEAYLTLINDTNVFSIKDLNLLLRSGLIKQHKRIHGDPIAKYTALSDTNNINTFLYMNIFNILNKAVCKEEYNSELLLDFRLFSCESIERLRHYPKQGHKNRGSIITLKKILSEIDKDEFIFLDEKSLEGTINDVKLYDDEKLQYKLLLDCFRNETFGEVTKAIANIYNPTQGLTTFKCDAPSNPLNPTYIFKAVKDYTAGKLTNLIEDNRHEVILTLNNYMLSSSNLLTLSKYILDDRVRIEGEQVFEDGHNIYSEDYSGNPELLFIRSNNFRNLLENTDIYNVKLEFDFFHKEIEKILSNDQTNLSPKLEFLLFNEYRRWEHILGKKSEYNRNISNIHMNIKTRDSEATDRHKAYKNLFNTNPICGFTYSNNHFIDLIRNANITQKISLCESVIHIVPETMPISMDYMFFFKDPYGYDPYTEWYPKRLLDKFKINQACAYTYLAGHDEVNRKEYKQNAERILKKLLGSDDGLHNSDIVTYMTIGTLIDNHYKKLKKGGFGKLYKWADRAFAQNNAQDIRSINDKLNKYSLKLEPLIKYNPGFMKMSNYDFADIHHKLNVAEDPTLLMRYI